MKGDVVRREEEKQSRGVCFSVFLPFATVVVRARSGRKKTEGCFFIGVNLCDNNNNDE